MHMLSLNYKLLIHLKCYKAVSVQGSVLARPSSLNYGFCPQDTPVRQWIQDSERNLHAKREALPKRNGKGSQYTCHKGYLLLPSSSHQTGGEIVTQRLLKAEWRTDLGKPRPGQQWGSRQGYDPTTTQRAVRLCEAGSCGRRHHLQRRGSHMGDVISRVTKGHNLLSKSKFRNCLLVGRPFLHHACRYTSMA